MPLDEIARRVLGAYQLGVPIEPIRKEISGISAAYAVQLATFDLWVKAGRRPVGHKIGLTARAVQEQLGVSEPDFGTQFEDMICPNNAKIVQRAVLQPRIEPEVAFVLKADLKGEDISPEAVRVRSPTSRSRPIGTNQDRESSSTIFCLNLLIKPSSVPPLSLIHSEIARLWVSAMLDFVNDDIARQQTSIDQVHAPLNLRVQWSAGEVGAVLLCLADTQSIGAVCL